MSKPGCLHVAVVGSKSEVLEESVDAKQTFEIKVILEKRIFLGKEYSSCKKNKVLAIRTKFLK